MYTQKFTIYRHFINENASMFWWNVSIVIRQPCMRFYWFALEKAVRFQNGDKALFLHKYTLNQRVREGAQVAFFFNKKKKLLAAVKISNSRNK